LIPPQLENGLNLFRVDYDFLRIPMLPAGVGSMPMAILSQSRFVEIAFVRASNAIDAMARNILGTHKKAQSEDWAFNDNRATSYSPT
jgi:hypothetical protein